MIFVGQECKIMPNYNSPKKFVHKRGQVAHDLRPEDSVSEWYYICGQGQGPVL
jgi:hypothetical protein